MCGILFTVNLPRTSKQIQNALHKMKHRGPDSEGNILSINNGRYVLGHNRLSIIDINERSNQPFYSQSKRHVIIYNGEIYNYKELIYKYKLSTRTTSDTELIIEGYEKYGPKIFNDFIGMFAFIIINTETHEYVVVRDRLGVKPIYHWQGLNNEHIYSSEISPILYLTNDLNIDEFGIRQYKYLRTYFNGHTPYKNINLFPAGYYCQNNVLKKYWEYPNKESLPPTYEELDALIRSAIQYRMVSDVSVGALLSGGLDSSIVTALSKVDRTWSVGFEDNNEFIWANVVSNKIGTKHSNLTVTKNQFIEHTNYIINKLKKPVNVPNEVLIYALSKKISKYNKVILSGEGADELFLGYSRIFKWASLAKKFDLKQFAQLYSYGSVPDYDVLEDAISPFLKYDSAYKITQAFFQIAHLQGLLLRLDEATMLNSIEGRVPFTDHRLIERMAGVSYKFSNHGGVKGPLKLIYSNILPKAIVQREKIGFPVNLIAIINTSYGEQSFDRWSNYNIKEWKRSINGKS